MTDLILSSKTFLAKSLGCRTNQAEIESISMELLNHGFKPENSKRSPDIILLNTCVVTSKAEKETRKEIRNLKKKYLNAFLVVLGCAVNVKNMFDVNLPEADLYISNKEKSDAVKIIIKSVETGHAPSLHKQVDHNVCSNNKYIQSGRKFIKIQDGCNGGCNFCLTQFVRGKPTSVPPEKVIGEINFWAERGIKEIVLTGINIGLYFDQRSHLSTSLKERPFGRSITNLVKKILDETKIERLTFSSIYPEMLTKEFLEIVVGNPRITQCFHLSLQSGSQIVLARMNRKTKLNELLKKLQWIKAKNPFFTFRADIITGFPNETEKEFQETLNFIKIARIPFAHIFTYSARKGTSAYEMIKSRKWQDISESIKKERSEKIRSAVKKTRGEEGKKMVGQEFKCLIIKKIYCSPQSFNVETGHAPSLQTNQKTVETRLIASLQLRETMYKGVTENGWPIRIANYITAAGGIPLESGKLRIANLKGTMTLAKITGFENDYLTGEITDLPIKGTKTSGISTDPSAF